MSCEEFDKPEILARYSAGQLSEAESQAWEEHYFGCDRCFADLQSYQAIRQELAAAAPAIRQEVLQRQQQEAARAAGRSHPWQWLLAGLAVAALLGAFGLWTSFHRREHVAAPDIARATPAQSYEEWARFEPPKYQPLQLRDAAGEPAGNSTFSRAMRRYQQHEFKEAQSELQAVVTAEPTRTEARFYLGACELFDGQPAAALANLQPVTTADSPYQEEARWLMAKAYLRQHSLADARRELTALVTGGGDWAGQAKQLLAQLPPQ